MTLLRPRIIAGATTIIVVFLLVSLAQEMNRRLQVQREVHRLQQEVQSMQKNIIELENLNQYFRTDSYQERLAREKLNYQAPGEKVVLVPHNDVISNQVSPLPAQEPESISIPMRWWRAFFVPEVFPSPQP